RPSRRLCSEESASQKAGLTRHYCQLSFVSVLRFRVPHVLAASPTPSRDKTAPCSDFRRRLKREIHWGFHRGCPRPQSRGDHNDRSTRTRTAPSTRDGDGRGRCCCRY